MKRSECNKFKKSKKHGWKINRGLESTLETFNDTCPSHTYLPIQIENFNINYVNFLELVLNKVIKGTFSNVIYTDSNVIFCGIYFQLPFVSHPHIRENIIQKLVSIENEVLKQYKTFFNTFKEPIFSLFTGIEIFSSYIIKISGIWESNTHYGINYRIVKQFNH